MCINCGKPISIVSLDEMHIGYLRKHVSEMWFTFDQNV